MDGMLPLCKFRYFVLDVLMLELTVVRPLTGVVKRIRGRLILVQIPAHMCGIIFKRGDIRDQ